MKVAQTVHPVLIVTGGSGGIGSAIATMAAMRGYKICVHYHRNQKAAVALVKRLAKTGAVAIAVRADISVMADVVRMFKTVDRKLGRVSALVNNAGTLERQCRVDSLEPARLQRIFAINTFGAFYCSKEAVCRMSTKLGGRGGAIVNVSSGAVASGAPNEYVDYAASKGALDVLTRGLSREVASEGIRVNTVRPGHIHTPIHSLGGEPNRISRLETTIPMGRGGSPEEVAQAVLWLLSPESSYVTGACLDVSGGK
ncbi:Glucose 1-dehydrogenase 1 [Lacunisphaera limnophila]|uniref:Glucose 1-dehydrogenase 1 n=1 Tax=Lacunisphaera limnophila TaxID=1838286 RepID=A0A1D8AZ31_9BACT|nr:Glucose 1-dehydrogenase 1 [Lacunisphaera limnophila]